MDVFSLGTHAAYFRALLDRPLPSQLQGMDSNRLTLTYFAAAGVDLLGEVGAEDGGLSEEDKERIATWVLSLQIAPPVQGEPGGFRGAPFFVGSAAGSSGDRQAAGADGSAEAGGTGGCEGLGSGSTAGWDLGHLAMTYSALALLCICDRGLAGVDVAGAKALVRAMQGEDGGVGAHAGGERDMRFLYCAAAVCRLLGDWEALDVDKASAWVLSCQSYEGGFGLAPGLEAHGGSTYCGVAALSLMGRLEDLGVSRRDRLARWCVGCQVGGFQGRTNKPPDTCYSFWIGASLHMLSLERFLDSPGTTTFAATCEACESGGFGKHADSRADPLHSYMSLAG
ncbi:terpenoid cyclases/protein prenyltransferase alpha-alpha toroid, partial [Baffinella frigidus]